MLDIVRIAVAHATSLSQDSAAKSAEPLKRQPQAPRAANATVALALSGGRDSMALLDLLARLASTRGTGVRRVIAIHVHHGLSRNADAWLAHCEAECARMGVPLITRRVEVKRRGRGIEAAAREVRYAALADAAREAGARIVMTAHHRDDRLETFLLQWMRGAGPDGLAAFPAARAFSNDLQLLRPLVDIARTDLERYVALRALNYVDDDSNDDVALLRNAVRRDVLPRIDALRPGFRTAAARSVDLVAEAAEAMRSVAANDYDACADGAPGGMLRLDRLVELPAARQTGVLRAWLAEQGLQAPSRARLLEVLDQARNARSDARLLVRLGSHEVRRYRGLLLLKQADDASRDSHVFKWRAEDEMPLPSWGGVLRFSRGGRRGVRSRVVARRAAGSTATWWRRALQTAPGAPVEDAETFVSRRRHRRVRARPVAATLARWRADLRWWPWCRCAIHRSRRRTSRHRMGTRRFSARG